MSLLFLSSDDFNVSHRDGENILYHEIRGLSLVLFYSNQCRFCQQSLPVFKRLPDIVNGCQFGMINVSMNKSVLMKSMDTITPIKYVPLIILYINGRPYMRYDGPHTENDLRQFILEVSNSIQEIGFTKVTSEKGIPSYSVGIPLCGEENVSYLEFNEAYIQ